MGGGCCLEELRLDELSRGKRSPLTVERDILGDAERSLLLVYALLEAERSRPAALAPFDGDLGAAG